MTLIRCTTPGWRYTASAITEGRAIQAIAGHLVAVHIRRVGAADGEQSERRGLEGLRLSAAPNEQERM